MDEPDKQTMAKTLAADGMSDSAIARELGVSRQKVWYWLKGFARPRPLSEKSKQTRRDYMRDFMRKRREAARIERLMT